MDISGSIFTAINDHQPLKSIFSKSIVSCLPHIHKFFLCLQKYEFDLKYSPGKTILVLVALIWAYIKNWRPEFDENSLIHHVHFVISNLPVSNERLEQFKEETWKDSILEILIKYASEGWPEKTFISHGLHLYCTHRSDISYHEGLLVQAQQIVVPKALRSEMKSIIHQVHVGIDTCKKRARQALFWPLINKKL